MPQARPPGIPAARRASSTPTPPARRGDRDGTAGQLGRLPPRARGTPPVLAPQQATPRTMSADDPRRIQGAGAETARRRRASDLKVSLRMLAGQ